MDVHVLTCLHFSFMKKKRAHKKHTHSTNLNHLKCPMFIIIFDLLYFIDILAFPELLAAIHQIIVAVN